MTSNKLLYRLPKMKGFRVTWLKLVASFICQNSSCFLLFDTIYIINNSFGFSHYLHFMFCLKPILL